MSIYSEHEQKVKAYDPSMWIGQLAWFTVSQDACVDHADFCKTLLSNGISTSIPPPPRAGDVFRRACTASQRHKVPTNSPTEFVNYLIREVGKNTESVWRRLVTETVDTSDKVLSYKEVATFEFNRAAETVTVTPMPGVVMDATAKAVAAAVQGMFKEHNNILTPWHIRDVVRKTFYEMNATMVRPSGAIYFVRSEQTPKLGSLGAVLSSIPGCTFHTLPLLDEAKQRLMIKEAIEDESIGDLDNIFGEISTILKTGRKITKDRYADIKDEVETVKKRVVDYSELLDESLTATSSRLEMSNKLLFQLLGNIKG